MFTGLIALSAMSLALYHLSKMSSILNYNEYQASRPDDTSTFHYTPSAEMEGYCNKYCSGVDKATKYGFRSSYDSKTTECQCLDDSYNVLWKISVDDLYSRNK